MRSNLLLAALAACGVLVGCEAMRGHKSNVAVVSAGGTAQAYDVDGTITQVRGNKVTLAREGLPVATLHVEQGTQVTLNGTAVDARALPEGGVARAKFQLRDSEPIALQLEVKSPMGGQTPMDETQQQQQQPQNR